MRAVWLTAFGEPEVLVAGDAPDPERGPGQVLIAVEIANVTFVETQFRATGFGPFAVEPPLIPGNGVGGVVLEADDPALIGRRVVTSTGGSGGYAELVAVPAEGLIEIPEGLALDDAVAVLADGRTATMLVEAAGVKPGERVLVEAAAGGVGSMLVQMVRNAGGSVIAAAGGSDKMAVAAQLGALETVDYREDGWTAKVAAPVDVVFDGVGGKTGREAFELLRPGGRMLSFGQSSGEWTEIAPERAAERGVTVIRPRPDPARLRGWTEEALAQAAAGKIRPLIGQRFPLERAADAHRAIESRGTVGKTLLETRK